MERQVRYCTTEDGVRIAYSVEGEGPALLVYLFADASFALDHMVPELELFMRKLGEGRQLVRFDGRGYGLSERDVQEYSLDAYVRDIEAVVKAANIKHLSIWAAANLRAPVVFTARHRELVRRLVLYGSASGDPTLGFPPESARALAELSKGSWDLAAQIFADMVCRPDFPEVAPRIADWYRRSATGDHMWKIIRAGIGVDIRPWLAQIGAPTLVLHRLNDAVYAFAHAQSLAANIPGARLVPLEGNVSAFFLGDTQSILDAVNEFLDEGPETRRRLPEAAAKAAQGPLLTVLWTDIVGHTEMMQRLGDKLGREVLREHERITREVLKAHGGTEVKTMGDGFMASFGSVTRAVDCAIALQKAFDEWNAGGGAHGRAPLHVRVGLNAGEPVEEEGDLFGASVILAARIAAQAEGGQILIPEPVRHLLAGKGFLFSDRGEFVAKGFEEPLRLYEVKWRG